MLDAPSRRRMTRRRLALVAMVTLGASASAQAGERVVEGWFVISRSCLPPVSVKESITYRWPGWPDWFWTASTHNSLIHASLSHTINTYLVSPETGGWQRTSRSWIGHVDLTPMWVHGYHWTWREKRGHFILAETDAINCNIGAPGA